MPVPKHYDMHKPLLEILRDGAEHSLKDIQLNMIERFKLRDEDLAELLPSGRQAVFPNRVGWARTYLKKAGLIESPARAMYRITASGLDALATGPEVFNTKFLMNYESFRDFAQPSKDNTSVEDFADSESSTPDDDLELSFKRINDTLADELLSEVLKISPFAFEKLVIDLLYKMGYGAFENAGSMTAKSGDSGIDGIIMEDKLGFNLIYIQAKQWAVDNTVGRPEIQSFIGAIGKKNVKGLFVTTSKYSNHAIECARENHIILIDGHKLTKLMIEHNFGVNTKKVFEIKAIDSDLFNDYL